MSDFSKYLAASIINHVPNTKKGVVSLIDENMVNLVLLTFASHFAMWKPTQLRGGFKNYKCQFKFSAKDVLRWRKAQKIFPQRSELGLTSTAR